MNNSAETETFKFSGYTSPFKPSNGTNSYVNLYDDSTDTSADYQYIIGGFNNTIGNASTNSGMFSVTNGYMNGAGNNFMAGGYNNTMGYNWRSAIIGGASNSSQGGYVSMFSCESSSQNAANSSYMGFFNCVGVTTYGNFYNWGTFIGGVSCYVGNAEPVYGFRGSIFGSYNSKIADTSESAAGTNTYPILVGGNNNKILGDTTIKLHNSIYNGSGNTITQSQQSTILGSYNNTISGKTGVVMLGTSGRTANADNTTYVENLQVFRQAKYGNYNNGNVGTSYQIDWDNGNIQKIVLTANTTFSATNITDGTTYVFKVQQDASGNRIATWTSSQFKFPNSTPPTLSTGANAVDIFTFVAMDGVLYGVAQLNFG